MLATRSPLVKVSKLVFENELDVSVQPDAGMPSFEVSKHRLRLARHAQADAAQPSAGSAHDQRVLLLDDSARRQRNVARQLLGGGLGDGAVTPHRRNSIRHRAGSIAVGLGLRSALRCLCLFACHLNEFKRTCRSTQFGSRQAAAPHATCIQRQSIAAHAWCALAVRHQG